MARNTTDLIVSDQPISRTWLGSQSRKKREITHCDLKRVTAMYSSSCYVDKEESENTSYPNTPKTKDNTVIGKGASEDPTRPCEWKPQKSSILVGSAQRNLLLSSQRDRRMAKCSKNKFPKSYRGGPNTWRAQCFTRGHYPVTNMTMTPCLMA